MSHQFEAAFFVRQPAWHRLGVLLPEAPGIEEAIRLAGLNWKVELAPITTHRGEPIDSHRAVIRETDRAVLGVVGNAYRPLQNERAFSFFEPFVTSGACALDAAGSLKRGRRVWVLAKVKSALGEVVPGDSVQGYFLLSNAHDGSQAVRAQFTNIRVVCMNTLTLADRRAQTGVEDCVKVRHTAGLSGGLSFVQKTIDMAHRTFSTTLSDYQRMASRGLPVQGLVKYVADVLEVPAHVHRLGQMPKAWEQILRAYYQGPGAEIDGVFGTYWGAYNAVTDWVDHSRKTRGGDDARLDAAWFGSGVRIKTRAFEAALAA